MNLSVETVREVSSATGFRAEMVEKVAHLLAALPTNDAPAPSDAAVLPGETLGRLALTV